MKKGQGSVFLSLLVAGMLGTAGSAKAAVAVLNLGISGNPDNPTFTISNESTQCCGLPATLRLDLFELLIRDPAYNFDRVTNITPVVDTGTPMTFTLTRPDSVDGSVRSRLLSIEFSGFDVHDSLSFNAEIDKGSAEMTEDYHAALLSPAHYGSFGGDFTNPTGASVRYAQGSFQFALGPNGSYQAMGPVPIPGTLPLMGGALAALGLIGRRRGRSAA